MDDYSGYSYGTEVEFPDGTTQVDPYTDAQGYVYETQQDWIDGSYPYEDSGYTSYDYSDYDKSYDDSYAYSE